MVFSSIKPLLRIGFNLIYYMKLNSHELQSNCQMIKKYPLLDENFLKLLDMS